MPRRERKAAIIDLTITASLFEGWQVLSVSGELDLATSATLREEVREHDESFRLAIDVSDVSFVDSSGLGVMVASLKHVRERGGALAIVTSEASPVARLLQLTGLDRIVPVARTLTDLSSIG